MPDESTTIGERMKEARMRTAYLRREPVSQRRMGELVGAVVGREIAQATWSTYELCQLEPPLDVIQATAAVADMSELYLAFGREKPAAKEAPPREVTTFTRERLNAHEAPRPQPQKKAVGEEPTAKPRKRRR